jgi:F-type H+-transporting ATPase subunit b
MNTATTAVYVIAAEGNGYQLAHDIREVIWGSIAFFIVAGLIIWKGGPAIKKAMADRTARIETELAEAKSRREAAEAALNASTSDLPDVSEEEDRIRAEAHETAARLKTDLIAKAEAEAEGVRERGKTDVANRKRQARADLQEEIAEATRRAAEDMVKADLDTSAQSDLIESYINQVSQMS